MKFKFSRQIFEKVSNIKFDQNPTQETQFSYLYIYIYTLFI